MPIIKLTLDEHIELTQYLGRAYDGNYRSDRYDTSTVDSMADKCFDAVNNLAVDDF